MKVIFRLSPLSHRGYTPYPTGGSPSGIPTPRYTGSAVAGLILLGFVSLGRLWFRRRVAEPFSLLGARFPTRRQMPVDLRAFEDWSPLQCTTLDTVSSLGAFRVSSPGRGNVPSLCRATTTPTLQPARTLSRYSPVGTPGQNLSTPCPRGSPCLRGEQCRGRIPHPSGDRRTSPPEDGPAGQRRPIVPGCSVPEHSNPFCSSSCRPDSAPVFDCARRQKKRSRDFRIIFGGLFLSLRPSYSCKQP